MITEQINLQNKPKRRGKMQRIKRKIKRNVSILLILAMLLGGIPQNALVVSAAEAITPMEVQSELPNEILGEEESLEQSKLEEENVVILKEETEQEEGSREEGSAEEGTKQEESFQEEGSAEEETKQEESFQEEGSSEEEIGQEDSEEETVIEGAGEETPSTEEEAGVEETTEEEVSGEEVIAEEETTEGTLSDTSKEISENSLPLDGVNLLAEEETQEIVGTIEVINTKNREFYINDGSKPLEKGEDGKYIIPADIDRIFVNVKFPSSEPYRPVVKCNGNDGIGEGREEPYHYYVFLVSQLQEENVLVISDKIETVDIYFEYDEEIMEIKAYVDGREIVKNPVDSSDSEYTVAKNTEVVFDVSLKEEKISKYRIIGANVSLGSGAGEAIKVSDSGFSFTTKATSRVTATIESEALYRVELHSTGGKEIFSEKGIFPITRYTDYVMSLYCGEEPVEITKVSCEEIDKNNWENIYSIEAGKVNLKIPNGGTGKDLIFVLTPNGEEDKTVEAKVHAKPAPKAVYFLGKTKVKVDSWSDIIIEQAIGTTKVYGFQVEPADRIFDFILVPTEEGNSENIIAEKTGDGKIQVTVNAVSKDETAVYELKEWGVQGYSAKRGTITIKPSDPAWSKVNPTVKLKSSDDIHLVLDLSAKGVEQTFDEGKGSVYYEISATPLDDKNKEIPGETKVYYEKYTGSSQQATIKVIEKAFGEGEAKKFNLVVSLVQTNDNNVPENPEDTNIVFRGTGTGSLKNAATKTPYYETKLFLKKGAATIYTGQQNVLAATAVFGKNTTYTSIERAEILEGIGGIMVLDDFSNGEIKVNVDKGVPAGKYTLKVYSQSKEGVQPSTATITLTVAKGIEHIALKGNQEIYKPNGKEASFNLTVFYNGNIASEQPKLKKVNWEILNEEGNPLQENDPAYGNIKVANGKVTISKNYRLKAGDNQYIVKASATDYQGNTTESNFVFTINNKAIELGKLVLTTQVNEVGENPKYRIETEGGTTLYLGRTSELGVRVLKNGIEKKEFYEESDFISERNIAFSSSNTKVISFGGSQYSNYTRISLEGVGKNVKITATATDGSKATVSLSNLNVDYKEAENVYLRVSHSPDRIPEDLISVQEGNNFSADFYGPKDSIFAIYAGEKDGVGTNLITAKHNLKVSGGKILSKDDTSYTIVGTSDKIVLTLTYGNRQTKTYTLNNKSLGKNSFSIATKDTLIRGYDFPVTINYQLSGKGLSASTHARVTINAEDRYKAKDAYDSLIAAETLGLEGVIPISENGKIAFNFNKDKKAHVEKYSYKLKVSLGTIDKNNNFIAQTAEKDVVLSAVEPTGSKLQYGKLTTKYTLAYKEQDFVQLTSATKGNELSYVGEIRNANVNGNPNQFTKYFKLEGTKLKLQDGITPEDLKAAKKEDLTGWISGYSFEYSPKTPDPVQITVNLIETAEKYTLTSIPMLQLEPTKASVHVTANKNDVAISHAIAEGSSFSAQVTNGKIVLTAAKPTVSSHKNTVYFVPEGSCYESELNDLKQEANLVYEDGRAERQEAYETAVKNYGIKGTVTVTVKAKDTTKGKIKLTTKGSFVNSNFTGDPNMYLLELPYTKTVDHKVIAANVKYDSEVFSARVGDGNRPVVVVNLLQEGLKNAVEEKQLEYGKTVKVDLEVIFSDNALPETFSLNLTLPKKAMGVEDVASLVDSYDWSSLETFYDKNWSEEGIISYNQNELLLAIENMIAKDSSVSVTIPTEEGRYQIQMPDNKAMEKGSIIYTVVLQEGDESKELKVTLDLHPKGMIPQELQSAVQEFCNTWSSGKATNDTTYEKLSEELRKALGMEEYKALRAYAVKNYWPDGSEDYSVGVWEKATESKAGRITGAIIIKDISGRYKELQVEFDFTIDQLKN